MFSLSRFDLESWFAESEPGQQMLAERRAKHLAERQSLVDQLEELDAAAPAAHEEANKAAAKALAEYKKAEAIFRKKADALNRANADRLGVSHSFTSSRQTLERQLRDSADSSIDDFIRDMRQLAETERHRDCQTEQTRGDWRGLQFFETTRSTRASLVRRLEAIGAAITAAELLKTTAYDDIDGELQRLRESLPDVVLEPVSSGIRNWLSTPRPVG